jgi:predicted kinase
VVSGPPASGKSTLAPQIAAHLGLPLLAKDVVKDALMRSMPPADVEASRRLGSAAVEALFALAADATRGAVIESVFYRSRARSDIVALPGRVLEVFCRCDRDVASARYLARAGTRAAGHFDAERPHDELWHPDIIEPVAGGWPVVEVDTTEVVDLRALLQRIDAMTASLAR